MNNHKDFLFNLNMFKPKISKKNVYNNQETCVKNKASIKWVQTNPKFKTFNQIYYTAGDYQDFDKYGLLPLIYYLSEKKNPKNLKDLNIHLKNNTSDIFKLYKEIDYVSCLNTFNYIFHKLKKGIFVIIQNNELKLYLPFSNAHYKNNWYKNIYFTEEEKKLIKNNDYDKIKDKLKNYSIDFMKKYPDQFKGHSINFYREKWHANNCMFRNQYPEYEGDLNTNVFKNMFDELVKHRTIPDVQFFINYRDFPILKKNLTEPYNHLFNSNNVKIEKEFQYKKFCPIFSQSITNDFADLLMPTNDDWVMATSKYFTDGCTSSYNKQSFDKMNLDWKTKKNICVFRGSATGCGITLENNMRLKAAQLSLEHENILDAGITDWKARPKKYSDSPIQIINPDDFQFKKALPLTRAEQSNYKYILDIEGYVSAFRLSSELRMRSVILLVDSDYKLWYSQWLVPYEHFVPVKKDLSDLIEIIQWCIKHDKECSKIAENAYTFYEKYLTKDGIFDYLQKKMNTIYLNRNLKNPLVLKKVKKNVAIIVCYRDSGNGLRKKQKDLFIKIINRIFPELFNFHLYIIEQSIEGAFNIGKLKNIGFEIACKNDKYDHFIFSDVDMIPDYDLLKYYQKKFDIPVTLAATGTRYSTKNKTSGKPFIGGALSITKKIFEKINGYPNNMRGWGGEDDSLFIRLVENKLYKLGYPKEGSVIDIEEDEKGKTLSLDEKLKKLDSDKERENLKLEKLLIDIDTWKKNGLSNLDYNILKTHKVNDMTTQITVDLLYNEEERKYPFLFPKGETFKNNSNYKKFKKDTYDTLNTYYHQILIEHI